MMKEKVTTFQKAERPNGDKPKDTHIINRARVKGKGEY